MSEIDFSAMTAQERVAAYLGIFFFMLDDENLVDVSVDEKKALLDTLAYGILRDKEAREFIKEEEFPGFGNVRDILSVQTIRDVFTGVDLMRNEAWNTRPAPQRPFMSNTADLWDDSTLDADAISNEIVFDILLFSLSGNVAGAARGAIGGGIGGALATGGKGARLASIVAGFRTGIVFPALRGASGAAMGVAGAASKAYVTRGLIQFGKALLAANVATAAVLSPIGIYLNATDPQEQEYQEAVAIAQALSRQGGFSLPDPVSGQYRSGDVLPDGRVVGSTPVAAGFIGPSGSPAGEVLAQEQAGYVSEADDGRMVGGRSRIDGSDIGPGSESFGTYQVGEKPSLVEADDPTAEDPYVGGFPEDYTYNFGPTSRPGGPQLGEDLTRKPIYRMSDIYEILGNMSEGQLVQFQEWAIDAKLINPNSFDWAGPGTTVDRHTIVALQEILAIANATGEQWQPVMQRRIKQVEDAIVEEDLRQPFQPQAYLALDPARATQEVKQAIRSQLGREPNDWEIQLLAQSLMKDHRSSFDAMEQARRNEYDHMGFLLEEETPLESPHTGEPWLEDYYRQRGLLPEQLNADQDPNLEGPATVHGVDYAARFAERFENRYADELERRRATSRVRQATGSLMTGLNRAAGAFRR